MKLIVDEFIDRSELKNVILEANNGKDKRYYIEGCFAQADIKNRNGRIYPLNVMKEAVDKYQEMIASKRALSELNHPPTPSVNPERASHIIEKLEFKNSNVIGKARILESEYFPMAKIAIGLIREGVKFGVSTRGLGSLSERNGTKIVESPYILTAIDLVADPSAPDAFVNGLYEQAEWIFDASAKSWKMAEAIKNSHQGQSLKRIQEASIKDFERFLKSL